MPCQNSFHALSLSSPLSDTLHLTLGEVGFKILQAENPNVSHGKNIGAFPSALLLADYPFRIFEASESFAEILGFRLQELDGNSLRLVAWLQEFHACGTGLFI